jgi:hypothetical protein
MYVEEEMSKEVFTIQILGATLEDASLKKGNFFYLISNLFCQVKSVFRLLKKCFFEVNCLPCLGWRSAIFTRCLSPKKLQDQCKHSCSSFKISINFTPQIIDQKALYDGA